MARFEHLTVCFVLGKPLGSEGATDMWEYVSALASHGHRVCVLCPSSILTDAPPPNVAVYSLGMDISSKLNPIPSTRLAHKTRSLLRDIGWSPDVTHHPAFPEFGLFLGPLVRGPSVLDIRSLPVSSRAAHALGRHVLRTQRLMHTKAITLHEKLAEQVLGLKLSEVPVGVNLQRFTPGSNEPLRQTWRVEQNEMVGIYSGTLHRARKPEALVEALALALKGGTRCKLAFVGGTAPDIERLRSVAMAFGVAGQVVFTGRVPYEEIPSYLRVADFGISYVPQVIQFEYQPPLKVPEYLACGLPVVATATKGNQRFIRHGYNGLLVSDVPEAFARALSEMVSDAGLRKMLAANARASVLDYDYKAIVERALLPVYREAIAASK